MKHYYAAVRRELKTLRGKEVLTTGDGLLATFDLGDPPYIKVLVEFATVIFSTTGNILPKDEKSHVFFSPSGKNNVAVTPI